MSGSGVQANQLLRQIDCAAFTLTHGLGADIALDVPDGWSTTGFIRTTGPAGETAVHVRSDGTRHGAEGEPDETNRPWLSLACRDGAIVPSLFWPGLPPLWRGREAVTVNIAGKFDSKKVEYKEPSPYALLPDAAGRVLAVAPADAEAFLAELLAYPAPTETATFHHFTLEVEGDTPLASKFTLRHPLTTLNGETAHMADGMDAACAGLLTAAMERS